MLIFMFAERKYRVSNQISGIYSELQHTYQVYRNFTWWVEIFKVDLVWRWFGNNKLWNFKSDQTFEFFWLHKRTAKAKHNVTLSGKLSLSAYIELYRLKIKRKMIKIWTKIEKKHCLLEAEETVWGPKRFKWLIRHKIPEFRIPKSPLN